MEDQKRERLSKLKALAESWGGTLKEVPTEDFKEVESDEGFIRAPFTSERLGIKFQTKEVIFSGDVVEASVIHEMGHVFATHEDPYSSVEWDFFGWEYVLARHIGLPVKTWLSSNSDYGVEPGRDLSQLNNKEICTMIHERVQTAKEGGHRKRLQAARGSLKSS